MNVSLGFALLLTASALFGQWPPFPGRGIPRSPDGKPDLAAPTPRTSDGKPDLSGLWAIQTEEYWYDIGADLKPDGVPLQSSAAAIYGERRENLGKDNPIARCLPAGVPTIDTIPTPFRVYQNTSSNRDSLRIQHAISADFPGWPPPTPGSKSELAGIFGGKVGGKHIGC